MDKIHFNVQSFGLNFYYIGTYRICWPFMYLDKFVKKKISLEMFYSKFRFLDKLLNIIIKLTLLIFQEVLLVMFQLKKL